MIVITPLKSHYSDLRFTQRWRFILSCWPIMAHLTPSCLWGAELEENNVLPTGVSSWHQLASWAWTRATKQDHAGCTLVSTDPGTPREACCGRSAVYATAGTSPCCSGSMVFIWLSGCSS